MGDVSFEVVGVPTIPLIGHVPHAGTAVPQDVGAHLTISSNEINAEISRITDHHTDRLFHSIVELGGVMFVNRLSRLVIDPERFREDRVEPMAARGAGAVYEVTSDLKRLRRPLSEEERQSLLQRYYDPYALAMTDLVASTLALHGCATIVDCHSFPTVPLAYAASSSLDRPEICIGTDPFHTPDHIVEGLLKLCHDKRVEARVNQPYSGCYVPGRFFHREPRVTAVMIEVRRDLYMDEQSCQPSQRWTETKSLIDEMLQSIC